MLDLVPFAGARWQVMHDDVDAQFIGKALEFAFPQPYPRAIAAAAIRSDGQMLGARIANPADVNATNGGLSAPRTPRCRCSCQH